MDPLVIILYLVLAVILGLVIFQNTGKRKATNKAKAESAKQALADGTYRTTTGQKVAYFFIAIFFYGLFAFIFSSSSPAWMMTIIVISCVVGAIFGAISVLIGSVAEQKGRSFVGFYLLSLLISPIIMGIVVAAISPLPGSSAYKAPTDVLANTKEVDSADQLKKLAELRDAGILTKAEFDAKKKELLDRI